MQCIVEVRVHCCKLFEMVSLKSDLKNCVQEMKVNEDAIQIGHVSKL